MRDAAALEGSNSPFPDSTISQAQPQQSQAADASSKPSLGALHAGTEEQDSNKLPSEMPAEASSMQGAMMDDFPSSSKHAAASKAGLEPAIPPPTMVDARPSVGPQMISSDTSTSSSQPPANEGAASNSLPSTCQEPQIEKGGDAGGGPMPWQTHPISAEATTDGGESPSQDLNGGCSSLHGRTHGPGTSLSEAGPCDGNLARRSDAAQQGHLAVHLEVVDMACPPQQDSCWGCKPTHG